MKQGLLFNLPSPTDPIQADSKLKGVRTDSVEKLEKLEKC